MDLYVADIDKNDKNTRRTIYEGIDKNYFGEVKQFQEQVSIFVKIIQMIHKIFQLIPRRIKKVHSEEILYAQVLMICRKSMGQKKYTQEKPKWKYLF